MSQYKALVGRAKEIYEAARDEGRAPTSDELREIASCVELGQKAAARTSPRSAPIRAPSSAAAAPATFADQNVSTGGLTAGQRFVSSEGYKAIVANRGEQWTTGLIEVGPSDVALGMKGTWWWTRRAGTALARCGLTNTTGRGN